MARMSKSGADAAKQMSQGPYVNAPLARAGMRIGLLGGSYDPPHEGHFHISLEAIKRLKLDQLWWLVSPGNPLKEQGPWPLDKRLQQCVDLAADPRFRITALEERLGSPYTARTLAYLTRRYRSTRFVWLMGADNMARVHLWQDWRQIFAMVPVAVLDRPGQRHEVNASVAAKVFGNNRVRERQAALILTAKTPAWSILSVPLNYESSTRIRQKHRS